MMLLWVVFSALTAAVVGALLWSYRRAGVEAGDAAHADVAVYADQLEQLEADRARGLISDAEAASARAEVARRLLSRGNPIEGSGTDVQAAAQAVSARSEKLLGAVMLSIPLVAVGLYAMLGSPGLPSQPHATRAMPTAGEARVDALIAKVEQRLREVPDDGNGWDVIAPIYLRMERYGQAAEAFANANRLLGETPKRLAGFVQSEILANNGIVNPNARIAAERLLALEPGRIDARLWLTLAKEQDGAFDAALQDYRAILADPNATEAMRGAIEQRIGIVEKLARGETVAPPGAAAPAADDQKAMIESMVARLAARLAADGKDPAGWSQLLRSYMVLGRTDDAVRSLKAARAALAGDAKGLQEVNGAAAQLGVEAAPAASGGKEDVK
jgi:cytochrome c-type biogenesis protein CcmH